MGGEIDQKAVENGGHLVDGVAEQKGAVVHRDLCLGVGQVAAVYIDDTGHKGGKLRKVSTLPNVSWRATQVSSAPRGSLSPDRRLRHTPLPGVKLN